MDFVPRLVEFVERSGGLKFAEEPQPGSGGAAENQTLPSIRLSESDV
jgi:hypothetical protein